MKIAVIGTGYVGLVTGVCFSEMGNRVICVDTNATKIQQLNSGKVPIYEPGLEDLVKKNHQRTLFFTTQIKQAIDESELIFIAVGTPVGENGEADLKAVFQVCEQIGIHISSPKIIVSKSTVPVGTCKKIKEIIQKELKKRTTSVDFEVVSNPEFLKEGAAISDFMKPDRIVIGAENEQVFSIMKTLYSPFFRTRDRFITMDIRSAEMTKYAANAMLATKISFINEIANICEKVGANVNDVRVGIGSDSRIGYDFIYPGIGYGGTCFPKDISALITLSTKNEYVPELISSVEKVNQHQKKIFLEKIIKRFGKNLSGFSFAIWGLSFKPETDDMRKSPAIYIVKELHKRGAKINVFDPKAMETAKNNYFKDFSLFYGENKYEIIDNSDALILLTEWKEFRYPNFEELSKRMKQAIIFDGRNQYKDYDLIGKGFEYHQIGKL